MALADYEVVSDKFEPPAGSVGGFAFPCCCCRHRDGSQYEDPCSQCGHNLNAETGQE